MQLHANIKNIADKKITGNCLQYTVHQCTQLLHYKSQCNNCKKELLSSILIYVMISFSSTEKSTAKLMEQKFNSYLKNRQGFI